MQINADLANKVSQEEFDAFVESSDSQLPDTINPTKHNLPGINGVSSFLRYFKEGGYTLPGL